MMQNVFKHIKAIFAFAMAAIMLLSLGGFSLYTHHCSHQNIENHSILFPAQACNHSASDFVESCCKVADEKTCCESKPPKEEKDCCSDEQEFVKLTIDTIINYNSPQIEVFSFDMLAYFVSEFGHTKRLSNCKLNTEFISDSPPTLSTSEYLSIIQVYLI